MLIYNQYANMPEATDETVTPAGPLEMGNWFPEAPLSEIATPIEMQWINELTELVPLEETMHILNAGSGPGDSFTPFLQELALHHRLSATFLEIQPEALVRLQEKRRNPNFSQGLTLNAIKGSITHIPIDRS